MAGAAARPGDTVVASPTWFADIRHYFTDIDIDHMGKMGVDLSTYEGVKLKASSIYFLTAPPSPTMPKDAPKWSAERSQTFKNWINTGFPMGSATPGPEPLAPVSADTPGVRLRKNVTTLSAGEVAKLKIAFTALMAKDPAAADSYFKLAGIHWLPTPTWCKHHENAFQGWHRVYLKAFEDALRGVPGCGDVTLPYWDMTTNPPVWLYAAPFDTYSLPADIGGGFSKGYQTIRNSPAGIAAEVANFKIPYQITEGLKQTIWETFDAGWAWRYHDNGHVSCGETMGDQDVAAFDPIFWFFHCNLDRLYTLWQSLAGATTPARFRTTLRGTPDWLEPGLNDLAPFPVTTDGAIEVTDVAYEPGPGAPAAALMSMQNLLGSVPAARAFVVEDTSRVSVRVKAIDRLQIPGSFVVHLQADGRTIAKQAFFQSSDPKGCATCRKTALQNIDFRLPAEEIRGKRLNVAIQLLGKGRVSDWMPLTSVGSPTINARLLLEPQ